MATEADGTMILPKLYGAGWSDDQISEQRSFTAGRIVVHGNGQVTSDEGNVVHGHRERFAEIISIQKLRAKPGK